MPETQTRPQPREVARLEALFRTHPIWREAARHIGDDASSDVYFDSQPGRVWHLVREAGETRLRPGPAADPDFVFRFTPTAVNRLAAADGSVGAFAVELFGLIAEPDPSQRIGFRIATTFPRLVGKGYLTLLAVGGLRVLAFGASRGIRTLSQLRALIEQKRTSDRASWETTSQAGDPTPQPTAQERPAGADPAAERARRNPSPERD